MVAAAAVKAVNDIRDRLEKACGRVVSCADIVTLAARDSVVLGGGPAYKVPLGRRDGLAPASEDAILGALSGGHTVGIAHCGSFEKRLFPTQDPTLNQWFAGQLRLTCPVEGATNTTVNDIRTPNTFDNKYYVDLLAVVAGGGGRRPEQVFFYFFQQLYAECFLATRQTENTRQNLVCRHIFCRVPFAVPLALGEFLVSRS
ncbi:peroxidase 12-like [Setaria viridis]|uniref:peroxidase 12-like n=1 Tax=Setaria viridis TaxID=4556 RepID=UPI003B3A3FBC